LILLYFTSGTYHVLPNGKAKQIFQILDHSAIYILISASYTPYLLTVIHGPARWILFTIQWSLTLLGIIFKSFFINRFEKFSTLLYLIMGWMVMFVFSDLKTGLSTLSLRFLVIGGITYSLGVFFYLKDKMKFAHFIWHLFVLGGSVCNYFSVYYILNAA
jgi:hemolysin III